MTSSLSEPVMPSAPAPTLNLSVFDHARDAAPKPRACTVEALVQALTRFPLNDTANKLGLPAWSPARFAPGRTRSTDAVIDLSCLVLDHDAGDPVAALAAWSGLIAVAHSTWSHTEDAPRFRVVVPLARPIPADRWAVAWSWASERAPEADRSCKDASRLYFRPAVPSPDAPRFARVQSGDLLDLLPLLPPPPAPAPAPARADRVTLVVPARLRQHAVAVRLSRDPWSRERVAAELGATLSGEGDRRRASGVACPACARASVWFFLAPSRQHRARCNHRNSCGWVGRLDELMLRGAA
jgi:hypothetical protein